MNPTDENSTEEQFVPETHTIVDIESELQDEMPPLED